MIRLIALVAFLTPAVAVCQVVHVAGGSSDVLGDGAQATYFAPHETITGSIGYHGHLTFGVQDAFDFHGFRAVAGQEQIALQAEGGSASIVNTGLSLAHNNGTSQVKIFLGSTGLGYSTPFFATAKIQHIGAGVAGSWTPSPSHRYPACAGFGCGSSMRHVTLSGLAAVDGGKKYLAGGAAYRTQRFYATASVGTLSHQRYWSAVAAWQPTRAFNISAVHASYFPQSLGIAVPNFAIDTVNANANFGIVSFGGGISKSSLAKNPGESVSASVRLGSLSISSTYLRAPLQSILFHTITERYRHWTISGVVAQVVQNARNQNSFNVSGGFTSNRFSLTLTHSMQMLATGQFAQTTAVSISVRLPRDLVIHVDTATDIFGRTTHTAQIETYQQVGNEAVRTKQTFAKTGRFVIRGRCEDEAGSGVPGCVIIFADGKHHSEIISNDEGTFEFREKRDHGVIVSADAANFVTSGNYSVVSSPNCAKPGQNLHIVVRRTQVRR